MLRVAFLLLSAMSLAACVSSTPPTDACEAARNHIRQCLGSSELLDVASESCDPNDAMMISSTPCEILQTKVGDRKSDLWDELYAKASCRLGFYRHCEVPACHPLADEPTSFSADDIPANASACAQQALQHYGCGACEYYDCIESQVECGDDGYLKYFAERYCERFRLVTETRASDQAKAWLGRVRRCLIIKLDAQLPLSSCDDIETAGFGSHSDCYLETGFCELSPKDWAAIINTIDPEDVDLQETLTTGHACLRAQL